MAGLLPGMALSCSFLACCNSIDLAQRQAALVAVAANQYSELMAYYTHAVFTEHPDLEIVNAAVWILHDGNRDDLRPCGKLQKGKKWYNNNSQRLKIVAVV